MNKIDIKNYFYYIIYQIIIIVSPLITIPYVSRILGAESIGKYSYTQANVSMVILFCSLGINLYAQREMAYEAGNPKNLSKIFNEMVGLRFITTSIGIALYVVAILNMKEYKVLYLIQLLDIIVASFDITWAYQALGRFKTIVIRNIIIKIAFILMVFLCVKTRNDLLKYVICYSGTKLLGSIYLWITRPSELKNRSSQELHPLRHLRLILVLFVPQIATQLYSVLDKSMIGSITRNFYENGYYEQATKIIHTILTLVTSLGIVMLTKNSRMVKSEGKELLDQKLSNMLRISIWLSIPIMFGSILLSPSIVTLILGTDFLKSSVLIQILSITIFLISISNVIGIQYLIVVNRHKEFSISVTIGACVNVVLNFILIPHYLSIGAAIASVISEFFVTLIQLYFVRKEIHEQMKITLINIAKCFLAAIIMFIILSIVGSYIYRIQYKMLLQILLGVVIYFLVSVLLKEENSSKILNNIKKIVIS